MEYVRTIARVNRPSLILVGGIVAVAVGVALAVSGADVARAILVLGVVLLV
jgi:hypothetical protein